MGNLLLPIGGRLKPQNLPYQPSGNGPSPEIGGGDPRTDTLLGNVFSGLVGSPDINAIRSAATKWFSDAPAGEHGGPAAGLVPFLNGGQLRVGSEDGRQNVGFGLGGVDITEGEGKDAKSVSLGSDGSLSFKRPGFGLNLNVNPNNPSIGFNTDAFGGKLNVRGGYNRTSSGFASPDQMNPFELLGSMNEAPPAGWSGSVSYDKPGFGMSLNANAQSPSVELRTNAFGGSLNVSGGYQRPVSGFAAPAAMDLLNVQPAMDPTQGGGWFRLGFSTQPQSVPPVSAQQPVDSQSALSPVEVERSDAQKFLDSEIAPLVEQYRNNPTSFFR